jgi:SPP1 family holin
MNQVKTDTIVRTIVLIIALANQILAILGKEAIPVTDDQIYQIVSLIVTIGASVWAWWKNNSFTEAAIEGDKVKDRLKQRRKVPHEL